MPIILFGNKKSNIILDEQLVHCPYCEKDCFADILVYSVYFHVYWVPIYPISKQADIICQGCGGKRYEVALKPSLFKNYPEIRNRYRHKWYTYSGVLFLVMIFVAALIAFIT